MSTSTPEQMINIFKARTPMQPLTPTTVWNAQLDDEIASLSIEGNQHLVASVALKAGLHLLNDSLNRSHAFAQQIEQDSLGAYWHGVMHRMEGDYSNAKYWFRQAGHLTGWTNPQNQVQRSIESSLATGHSLPASLISFGQKEHWDALAFTDLVIEQERGDGTEVLSKLLQSIQREELLSLIQYTYEAT
ncbi:hypothetical protein [Paenibacillus swuensis]|uniref:hypothetical protein n=1 Tax=Paenibacillus swuensis TaxID=1178515 RepID=UPI0008382384|nr:hypothetical protein [Paenibacillus swuensis]